jgi:hypothetical protein
MRHNVFGDGSWQLGCVLLIVTSFLWLAGPPDDTRNLVIVGWFMAWGLMAYGYSQS